MKVYVVYEYAVIEYEERFRIMGVFSSEDKAQGAIREYEKHVEGSRHRFEYAYEEYELDQVWEDWR